MRKALTLSLMMSVLILALVSRGYATQHIWSENFNTFTPIYGTNYDYRNWTEVQNRTNPVTSPVIPPENLTFTHSVADGILQLTAHTILAHTTLAHLTYYRELHIESSMTIEVKFASNGANAFFISFLHDPEYDWLGLGMFNIYCTGGEGYLKWMNTSGVIEDLKFDATMPADVWYTAKISWDASPNHVHALFYEGSNRTAIANATITNNLHDFTDLSGVAFSIIAYDTTVGFGRVFIDYIRVGSAGGSILTTGLIASIVSIAMLACCIGIIKKLGS